MSRSAHQMAEYQMFRAMGVCPSCRTADAVPGRSMCAACLQANRDRERNRRGQVAPRPPKPKRVLVCESCGAEVHTRHKFKGRRVCDDCLNAPYTGTPIPTGACALGFVEP
jgi:hypothetical protein